MSSATTTVLSIPELLQNILTHLSVPDLLLTAPLVSRTWQHAILSSPLLQQQLFLAPAPATTPRTVNPLLAAKFPALFDNPHFGKRYDMPSSTQRAYAPFRYMMNRYMRRYVVKMEEVWEMECFAGEGAREVYFYPGASWRKMLVVQPPVSATEPRDGVEAYGLAKEDLTMGTLFEELVQVIRADARASVEPAVVRNSRWKQGREIVLDWGEPMASVTPVFREFFYSRWEREEKMSRLSTGGRFNRSNAGSSTHHDTLL
ncbi:hypothetical protein VE01_08635 [Pseudogymnoascus verrucosus]|uniref:F-box domain-containing protein n=1 Tax=Pseudogymnoascus verrucosus TaxID=342668 RepID=A0A1B8GB53_9PEZI|nr:uncharacterized protein VE01_08635 [Pseudogymnoascus verrucosus]OBT93007.1 hypothetical protein VE01_08635 [Pseudogymnoascus verrucosus]